MLIQPQIFCSVSRASPTSTLFPYTTLFRSVVASVVDEQRPVFAAQHRAREHHVGHVHVVGLGDAAVGRRWEQDRDRSEEHTSELQSRRDLVCRLLLEKKKCHQTTPASTLP